MDEEERTEVDAATLRLQALERVRARQVPEQPIADLGPIVHELKVHQVELELQNEELRRTQIELQTVSERYEHLYELAPVAYLTLDTDGVVSKVNRAAGRLCGTPDASLVGAPLELLFADEDQRAKTSRDPVAPAKRSEGALRKASAKRLDDGSPVHSFRTLLNHLGDIVRNICRSPNAGPDAPTFHKTTTPNAKQQQALDLLHTISL